MKDRTSRIWVIGYWILSFALMVGTWKMLMANNTELVHYPQYFPEGLALAALTSSPAVHCPMTSTYLHALQRNFLARFEEDFRG